MQYVYIAFKTVDLISNHCNLSYKQEIVTTTISVWSTRTIIIPSYKAECYEASMSLTWY